REIFRLRTACLESGACNMSDPRISRFSRLLIKTGEHTWQVLRICCPVALVAHHIRPVLADSTLGAWMSRPFWVIGPTGPMPSCKRPCLWYLDAPIFRKLIPHATPAQLATDEPKLARAACIHFLCFGGATGPPIT